MPITSISSLLAEIKYNLEGDDALLQVYDLDGNEYRLNEVYQSDEGPSILCFDVQRID